MLTAVTICKGYDDYLAVTLPRNLKVFDRIIVITSEEDKKTQDICRAFSVEYVASKHLSGKTLPLGRALNDVIENLDGWACRLDSDIIVPFNIDTDKLDKNILYYVKRVEPRGYLHLRETLDALDRNIAPEVIISKLQAVCETDFHPWGYFQLFNTRATAFPSGPFYPGISDDAAWDDDRFSSLYGQKKWVPLNGFVLHLHHGRTQTNWKGRRSLRIEDVKSMSKEELGELSIGDFVCVEPCQYEGRIWVVGEKLRSDSKGVPRFFKREYVKV